MSNRVCLKINGTRVQSGFCLKMKATWTLSKEKCVEAKSHTTTACGLMTYLFVDFKEVQVQVGSQESL